jgi:eukaryotic-like serine/threonine-protein kinase
MLKGFRWCDHCSEPHALSEDVCPATRRAFGPAHHPVRTPPPPPKDIAKPFSNVILDGKYRLLSEIGAGGMGTVYEAEGLYLRRRVAIKIAARDHARLLREAELLASIAHPNICNVQDLGRTPWGAPYVVLERLYGETLAERLARGPLGVKTIVQLFCELLSGLHTAHNASIIHRDLKPHNVFLAQRVGCDPSVKLLDFGFAKDISGGHGLSMTRPGWTCGTFQYMAPEQLTGGTVDAATDIFATGLMLFEALAGRPAFNGPTMVDVQYNVLNRPPASLAALRPNLPRVFTEIVERALMKDPEERFGTALEFQQALRRTIEGDEETTTLVAAKFDDDEVPTNVLLPNLASSSEATPS